MNQPRSLSAATLGALGVVYGDIGTSPLYALREATAVAGGATDVTAMLGVLSLIFWSLLIVITLKYIVVILRMDNEGEGGVLSLVALVEHKLPGNGKAAKRLVLLAVLGTAFFYCDALITPAISVLGAIEGLAIIDPAMQRLVVPVHARHPRRPVRDAAPRHRAHRAAVRPDHGDLVRLDRAPRPARDHRTRPRS